MRFLDLDLDFFLNKNAYCSEHATGRLGSDYKPWSTSKVKQFLEERCCLSHDAPVQGRTVETHDGVFHFWRRLIESGGLSVPFDVIHIDAHPDLFVGSELYLTSGFLYVEAERRHAILNEKYIHAGNYLTFAIAHGWIASLVWVPLRKNLKGQSKWDGDARAGLLQLKKKKSGSSTRDLPAIEKEPGVPFKISSWNSFRTSETFDYIAFSKSPNFTPPESDKLIPIVEGYMSQI